MTLATEQSPAPPKRLRHTGAPVLRGGKVQPLRAAVVVDERWVFVSGQVPMRDGQSVGQDIATQTHYTIDLIESILAQEGCGLSDVVKVTAWLVNAGDYSGFNQAYGERFPAATAPTRSTVIAGLIAPVLLEMEALAIRPGAAATPL